MAKAFLFIDERHGRADEAQVSSSRAFRRSRATEGAVGAVLFNTVDQLLPVGAGGNTFDDPVPIPAFGIALSSGTYLRDLLTGGTAVEVQFDATFKNSIQKDGLADVGTSGWCDG